MKHFLAALVAGLALASGTASAQDNSYPAQTWTVPYSGKLSEFPACETESIRALVSRRFTDTRREYWSEPTQILSITDVQTIGFRPEGQSYIPRLYCEGVATTNDGVKRRVVYSIVEEGGMSGIGYGVDWCVVGLDPNNAYAPACRAALP